MCLGRVRDPRSPHQGGGKVNVADQHLARQLLALKIEEMSRSISFLMALREELLNEYSRYENI